MKTQANKQDLQEGIKLKYKKSKRHQKKKTKVN